MAKYKYRIDLPQFGSAVLLTDGGIETSLIFGEGVELPQFAAFPLLADEAGRATLARYFAPYLAIARSAHCGFVAESATWRASPDWAERLGFDLDQLAELNRRGIETLAEEREPFEAATAQPLVLSGCIGPRGDAYHPLSEMAASAACDYHAWQVETFAVTGADMVSALTVGYSGEAIGIVRAAERAGIPASISFTVETDGRLPSGERLDDAIRRVDDATGGAAAYYMVNCAHPMHLAPELRRGGQGLLRIRGLRANASTRSHAELDAAEELDAGDPEQLADAYQRVLGLLPNARVLGGCCGTDHRHIAAIARRCI